MHHCELRVLLLLQGHLCLNVILLHLQVSLCLLIFITYTRMSWFTGLSQRPCTTSFVHITCCELDDCIWIGGLWLGAQIRVFNINTEDFAASCIIVCFGVFPRLDKWGKWLHLEASSHESGIAIKHLCTLLPWQRPTMGQVP